MTEEYKNVYEKLKNDHIEMNKYYKKQMIYAGMLNKAITDTCSKNVLNKIIDRHLQLMREFDENSSDAWVHTNIYYSQDWRLFRRRLS